jgi:hypothetical protein
MMRSSKVSTVVRFSSQDTSSDHFVMSIKIVIVRGVVGITEKFGSSFVIRRIPNLYTLHHWQIQNRYLLGC